SAGEISRGLGIRVVGAVPRMADLGRQLVGAAGESELEGTPVMESIDAIRTRLLHDASTRSTRVVMVTSAGPGEGKTTLASALARGGLEGVFERLAEEFDFVIVDSHPVLEATDSLLIGRQADAVLLSVLREVSEMPRVYAASQQLSALGIRVLGAVVNGTSPE